MAAEALDPHHGDPYHKGESRNSLTGDNMPRHKREKNPSYWLVWRGNNSYGPSTEI